MEMSGVMIRGISCVDLSRSWGMLSGYCRIGSIPIHQLISLRGLAQTGGSVTGATNRPGFSARGGVISFAKHMKNYPLSTRWYATRISFWF